MILHCKLCVSIYINCRWIVVNLAMHGLPTADNNSIGESKDYPCILFSIMSCVHLAVRALATRLCVDLRNTTTKEQQGAVQTGPL